MSNSYKTVGIKNINPGNLKTFFLAKKPIVEEREDCFEKFSDLDGVLKKHSSMEVYRFISEQLDLQKYSRSILFCTREMSRTNDVDFDNLRAIINLKRLNYAKDIDEHLRALNTLLPDGGIYIGRAETYWERKKRIKRLWGKRLGAAVWIIDSIINRAFARMRVVEHIYRWITGGTFHMLSNTEMLGRLFYCGFSLIDTIRVDGLEYFSVIKTKEPSTAPPPSNAYVIQDVSRREGWKTNRGIQVQDHAPIFRICPGLHRAEEWVQHCRETKQ